MANFRWQVGGCGCDCGCETCTVSYGVNFSGLPAIAESYYRKNATPLSVVGVVPSSSDTVFPFNAGNATTTASFNDFQITQWTPPFSKLPAYYTSNGDWQDSNKGAISRPNYLGEFALGRNCSKTAWDITSVGAFQCGANYPAANTLTINAISGTSTASRTGPIYNSESASNPTLPEPTRQYTVDSVSITSVTKVSGPTGGYNHYECQFTLAQKVRVYLWGGIKFSDPFTLFSYPTAYKNLYSCAKLLIGGGTYSGTGSLGALGIVSIGGADYVLRPILLTEVNSWQPISIDDGSLTFPLRSYYGASNPSSSFIPESLSLFDANGNNSQATNAYWGDNSSFNDGGLYTSNGALYHTRGYVDVEYVTKSVVQFSLYREIVNNAAYWPSVATIANELGSKIPAAYNNYAVTTGNVPGYIVMSLIFRAFTFTVTGAIGTDGSISFPTCPDM